MKHLSRKALLSKLKKIKGLDELTIKALTLYYLLTDGETPRYAKVVAGGALLYLINPFDFIPDIYLITGYVDDLAVLVAALKNLNPQVQPQHKRQATDVFNSL